MMSTLEQIEYNLKNQNFLQCRKLVRILFSEIIQKNLEPEILWHPLGFLNLKFKDHVEKHFRLHIWLPNEKRNELGIIHNHNWIVESYVLYGELTNIMYKVISEKDEPTHRINEIRYNGLKNQISPTNKTVRICEISRDVFQRNTTYKIEIGKFHQTIVKNSDYTVTVVLEAETTSIAPEILKHISEKDSYIVERQVCDFEETEKILSKVINVLID